MSNEKKVSDSSGEREGESETVKEARVETDRAVLTLQRYLKEGLFSVDESDKEKRGNLSKRSVEDLVDIIQEIGIDRFMADESGAYPVFTHVDTRGRCFRIAHTDTRYSGCEDKHLFVAVSQDPGAEPSVLLDYLDRFALSESHDDEDTISYTSRMGGNERQLILSMDQERNEPIESRIMGKIESWWNNL